MKVIDCRGMRCPWPALRLARHLREADTAAIEVLADDPAAATELRVVAEANERTIAEPTPHRFLVSCAN